MEELKTEYNKLLARYFKATKWFAESTRTVAEQDKYLAEYRNILDDITKVTLALKSEGIELTGAECERGFE